jgi:hypothetical protein
MQVTLWVKEINYKEGAKGKYMVATCVEEDGKSKDRNVFDIGHQAVFTEAKEKSLAITATLEKKGNYWNITDAKLTKDALDERHGVKTMLPTSADVVSDSHQPSKLIDEARKYAQKPGDTHSPMSRDEQIARAVALKAAIDLRVGGAIEDKQLLSTADRFVTWLLNN